jgi:hypothetical protein
MKTLAALLLSVVSGFGQPILPDPRLTPGDVVTNVPVEMILARGYTARPGVRHTPESVKRVAFIRYFGKVPDRRSDYEVDHLISLELGGSNSISNLWPQSYLTAGFNAHTKDRLEDKLHSLVQKELVTNGKESVAKMLQGFQKEIASNWTNAYLKYVGKP